MQGKMKIKGNMAKATKFTPDLFPPPTEENKAKYKNAKLWTHTHMGWLEASEPLFVFKFLHLINLDIKKLDYSITYHLKKR